MEPTVRQDIDGRLGRLVAGYLWTLPLLWVLGLAVPAAGFLLAWLVVRGRTRRILLDPLAVAWYPLTLIQAWSVVVNWEAQQLPVSALLRRLASPGVVGWAMLGVAFAVGRSLPWEGARIRRATCGVGLYLLAGTGVSWLLFFAGLKSFSFVTPVGFFLPADLPARTLYFTAKFFMLDIDSTLYRIPRIEILYPWSVMLSFCSLVVLMIALGEKDRRWRTVGVLGGLLGIFGGQSRTVALCLILSVAVYLVLRGGRRAVLLATVSGVFAASLLQLYLGATGGRLADGVAGVYNAALEWRAGSTSARRLAYQASFEGFLRAPFIGHGWQGDFVEPTIPIPVGSTSSVFGLLYTAGALGLGSFVLALVVLVGAGLRAIGDRGGGPRAAVAVLVTIPVLALTESLFSYGPALMPFFVFFGAELARRDAANSQLRLPW